ncbi:MAG: type II toxin-antitoxin system RelE/ParE family toxin [Flavobacteriales bacterium]
MGAYEIAVFTRREALLDMNEAYYWHANEELSWGKELLEELQKAVLLTCTFPRAWPNKFRTYRELLLPRFPYILIYEHLEEKGVLVIYSLFPGRRDPAGKFRRWNSL